MPVADVGGGLSVITVDEYEIEVKFKAELMELDVIVNVTSDGACVLPGVLPGVVVCSGQIVTSDTVTVVNRGVPSAAAEPGAVGLAVTVITVNGPVGVMSNEVGLAVTVTYVTLGVWLWTDDTVSEGGGIGMVTSEYVVNIMVKVSVTCSPETVYVLLATGGQPLTDPVGVQVIELSVTVIVVAVTRGKIVLVIHEVL